MKLLIIQSLVVSVIGLNESSFFGEILSETLLANAKIDCRKAEDFKCPRSDISFYLYTSLANIPADIESGKQFKGLKDKSTQNNPTKLDQYNLFKLKQASFVNAPLKLLIPGYKVDINTSPLASFRAAYFSRAEYNLIFVDWVELGESGCYYQSVLNTPTIARCVTEFFNALLESFQFPSVHLIGHSVGAHIANLASHEIHNIQRFTVFDPALPFFPYVNLQNPEAQFVDVYHSNCGLYGQIVRSGNADIYFNNGVIQPGCSCVNTTCSHNRCVNYFEESIRNTSRMVSFQCEGFEDYLEGKCPPSELVVVGEGISYNTSGVFYVFTNSQKPFLVDPEAYTDPAWFNSFGLSVVKSCFSSIFRLWS